MNNTSTLSAKSYGNLKREIKIEGTAGNFTEKASYDLCSGRCSNYNVEKLKIGTDRVFYI